MLLHTPIEYEPVEYPRHDERAYLVDERELSDAEAEALRLAVIYHVPIYIED